VGDLVASRKELLQGAFSKNRIPPSKSGEIAVEFNKLQVLLPPGICPPAVRIRPSADTRLIPVIKGRSAGPCHLNHYGLPEYAQLHVLLRLLRTRRSRTAHHLIGSGKKPGMIMVGELI